MIDWGLTPFPRLHEEGPNTSYQVFFFFFKSSSQSTYFCIWRRIAWMRCEWHWAPYSSERRCCTAPLGNKAYWVSASRQAPEIQELSSAQWFTQIYSNSSTDWSVGKVSKWILCCFKALLALSWGQWAAHHSLILAVKVAPQQVKYQGR